MGESPLERDDVDVTCSEDLREPFPGLEVDEPDVRETSRVGLELARAPNPGR